MKNCQVTIWMVNIYTSDVNRTAWTLSSVLHAPDASQGDFYAGPVSSLFKASVHAAPAVRARPGGWDPPGV